MFYVCFELYSITITGWIDINTVALGAIIIAINLIVVVIHLSLNEQCKRRCNNYDYVFYSSSDTNNILKSQANRS